MVSVSKKILQRIYTKRPQDSHKYDFGLLLVVGGGEFYSGPPAFSALAALRAGVDMVQILAPKRAADIIASFSPVLASYPLEGKRLEKKHLSLLFSTAKSAEAVSHKKTAVVIGGGTGRSQETQDAILDFLSRISIPVVIDADAIHAISRKPDILSNRPCLVTPHSYEFFVLTGKKVEDLPLEEKIKLVKEEAGRLQTTILSKGEIDIISDGNNVALNKTGNPYLSKGGTGDTLAGICGGLIARGINIFEAAQAAAYINGKAGEIAASKKKEGLLATDLIEAIPEAISLN